MDKGRTGSQGPMEEPDEDRRPPRPRRYTNQAGENPPMRRRSRPQQPINRTGEPPYVRRPRPQRPSEEAGASGPPVRKTRPQPPPEEPNEDLYERRPRSQRFTNPPDENTRRTRPSSEEFDENYYEQRPRSRQLPEDIDEDYYERGPRSRRLPEEVDEDYYERRPRSQGPTGRPSKRLHVYEGEYEAPRRKRSFFSLLLTGCGLGALVLVLAAGVVIFLALRAAQGGGGLGGIINNKQTFSQSNAQTVNLAAVTRLQVCDKSGSVSIKADASINTITVTIKKTVQATSQSAANQEFARIPVEVQPPGNITDALTCGQQQHSTGNGDSPLTINANVPAGDSADLTISLPSTVLPSDPTVMPLTVEAPQGNISVDGLDGVMYLKGNNGDISVNHAIIANGTHIEAGSGNVTFNGILALPKDTNAKANYILQSGQGDVTVTLPDRTNINLDTYTNNGEITSEFTFKVKADQQAATYDGPLDTTQTPPANMFLSLHVSRGNVTIHKARLSG